MHLAGVTLTYSLSADQKTLTVTTSGLAATTIYHFWLGNWVALYDVAGNSASFSYQQYVFTTQ